MIFYLPVLCPDSDKFKNKRSYTSSHYNVRTDTLPLPLFYNNKKAGVGRLQLHGYMWFLLWKNDWGAELFLTAPALVDPMYTNTGRLYSKPVVYWEGGFGLFKLPSPEIPKARQNSAKLNPAVKTVKNCWI
jgi:hypothetical protein